MKRLIEGLSGNIEHFIDLRRHRLWIRNRSTSIQKPDEKEQEAKDAEINLSGQ